MVTEKQMENLKKGKATQFKSGEEAARFGSKGGKASGESRQINKTITQAVKGRVDPEKIAEVLTKRGYSGSLKAIEMIIELLGEKPTSKQEVSVRTIDKSLEEMEAYFNDKARDT